MEASTDDVRISQPTARQAFQRVWPTALAVMPVSGLFGVLAAQANWHAIDVFLFSLLGFSGSGQFALLPLAAQGTGFITMLVIAVSINCRYIPIAFVSAPRLPDNPLHRLCFAHILGDEAYAVERDNDSHSAVLIVRLTIYAAWVLSAVTGFLIAGLIPARFTGPAINLGFPASVVLLYLSFNQLRARLAEDRKKRLAQLAGFVSCIAVAAAAIVLCGPTYFWIPSIAVCTLIMWRAGT